MSKTEVLNGQVEFRALQLANEHRNAYGLRYNDYNRYRKHCGNRAHRLRSALKLTHGKGREFKKLPPITLENIKSGHLQLILFEAERAWAYSQELLVASSQPSNEGNANKIRHSATGRFRRAVHWATELLSHCQSLYSAHRLSAQNFVEVSAYALILSGRFLRYRDEHEDALDQLCVAHDLLDNLASCASTSHDQALAVLFSDEISPEIRYCAHQLGHNKSYDIGLIVREEAPKQRESLVEGYTELIKRLKSESLAQRDGGAKRLKSLMWEGQEVPVRNPELVDVLLQVQSAEAKLTVDETDEVTQKGSKGKGARHHKSRRGVAAFDAVLSALSEAEEVARKLAEAQKTNETTSHGGARDVQFLYSYITYHLLSRRIERDLTLISALVSASPTITHDAKQSSGSSAKAHRVDARVNPAIVKLLDTVLQSLTHMRNLHIVDDSPDLSNAVEARISYTKSRRSLYLSRSYAAVKQYPQAVALTQRAQLYAREASSLLLDNSDPVNAGSPSFYHLTKEILSSLQTTIKADEDQLKLEWFAFNGGATSSEKDISKKPVFFDIALNYLQLDVDKIQERAGLKQKEITRSVPAEPRPVVATAQSKVVEIERSATPNPPVESRSTLTSLLGGWWGRK